MATSRFAAIKPPATSAEEKHFADTLEASVVNGTFSAKRFFRLWFARDGRQHLFIFRKNLKVTNIQFAELLALVRTSIRDLRGHPTIESLQFLSVEEFVVGVDQLIADFPTARGAKTPYAKVAKLYLPLLERMVVLCPWFGSCEVHLPAHLELDASHVCASAGYVHACGRLVYARRFEDANAEEFIKAVEDHLTTFETAEDRRFVVYCHEDYTSFDRGDEPNLRHGLDELKIHLEKVFMGSRHLVDVVGEMRDKFFANLHIPHPGDYHRHDRQQASRTIWLLRDSGVHNNVRVPSDDSVFLCYEQDFSNRSPFQINDENKPAWVAHTTMPHSLAAAMLNITRRGWIGDQVQVCDPFAGTGTTTLECLKDPRLVASASDLNPISPQLIADNAAHFAMSVDELRDQIARIVDLVSPGSVIAAEDLQKIADREDIACPAAIAAIANKFEAEARDPALEFRLEDVERVHGLSLEQRVILYVVLRARRRHTVAMKRGAETEPIAFRRELARLLRELQELQNLRASELIESKGAVTIVRSRYSPGLTISAEWVSAQWPGIASRAKVLSVLQLPANAYDVIIADPPYGFNTEEEREALAELYAKAVPTLVQALRPGGQMVLCLPQLSKSGRVVPYFTQREIVTRQVVYAAEEQRRHVVQPEFAAPEHASLFRPPFYWDSERALRRSILHFRFS